jgi:hypothetical protein
MSITAPLIVILTATTLLMGCSRGPSESDIKTAYTNEVEQTNALTRQFGGDSFAIKVNDLKKVECKKTEDKDQYLCQINVDVTYPIVGRQQQNLKRLLIKDGKGEWTMHGNGIDP